MGCGYWWPFLAWEGHSGSSNNCIIVESLAPECSWGPAHKAGAPALILGQGIGAICETGRAQCLWIKYLRQKPRHRKDGRFFLNFEKNEGEDRVLSDMGGEYSCWRDISHYSGPARSTTAIFIDCPIPKQFQLTEPSTSFSPTTVLLPAPCSASSKQTTLKALFCQIFVKQQKTHPHTILFSWIPCIFWLLHPPEKLLQERPVRGGDSPQESEGGFLRLIDSKHIVMHKKVIGGRKLEKT